MKQIETAICWNITNLCNANCHFCHRMLNVGELTLEQNFLVLEKMIHGGVTEITWSGGECLMYTDIEVLIKHAYIAGIRNKLITNGKDLSLEKIRKIAPFLKSITFSLDSSNDNINEKLGRGRTQFKATKQAILYIKEIYPNIEIKINTVVSAINKREVLLLPPVLAELKIDRWKIFKFMDIRGKAKENSYIYSISDEEFSSIYKNLKSVVERIGVFRVQFVDVSSFEDDYIMVDASGYMYITSNGTDIYIGSLLNNSTSTLLNKITTIRNTYIH